MDSFIEFGGNKEHFEAPPKLTEVFIQKILDRFDIKNNNVNLVDVWNDEKVHLGDDLVSQNYKLELSKKGNALEILSRRGIQSKKDWPETLDSKIIRLLVESGESVNSTDYKNNSFAEIAIMDNDIELIDFLYNQEEKIRKTNICYASRFGNGEIISILINRGESVTEMNRYGELPLQVAVLSKNVEKVEILLNNGADINAEEDDGTCAIHIAVSSNDIDMIKTLIKRGANVNPRISLIGYYLINCGNQKIEIIKFLHEIGTDIFYCSKDNSVLYLALKYGTPEIVKELCERGANAKYVWDNEYIYDASYMKRDNVIMLSKYAKSTPH